MQHDPAVITGICRAVELAIERAVRLSPGTATQLQGLHPLDVAIHCTEPTISIFAFIDAAGMVKLASYRETKPTVAIEATWRDFGKLATAADPADKFHSKCTLLRAICQHKCQVGLGAT